MDYKNWLKVGFALQLTANALTPFCDDEMVSLHNSLKTRIGGNVCHAGCIADDLKRKGFICPSNVCHHWLAGIKRESATSQFCWKNTTVSMWPEHPWQIAQCLMGLGQDPANKDPKKTDPGGKLHLIINCGRFHPPQPYHPPPIYIDIAKVEKVIAGCVTEVFLCR